ncbi:MAG: beta strand repeat-containing protein, partial [Ferruginibacter sp.]
MKRPDGKLQTNCYQTPLFKKNIILVRTLLFKGVKKQNHINNNCTGLQKTNKHLLQMLAVAALLLIGNTKIVAQCTTPGWPLNVSGNAISTNVANITWSGGSPAGSATVNYYWVVGTWSNVPYGSGTNQSYTTGLASSIGGLAPNTTYYLRVYANTTCNNTSSLYSTSSFITYPLAPTSVSASATTICAGSSTTLTASGVQGDIYWYSGGCGQTLVGSGNPITLSPSVTTTYYAKNYNGNYSTNCASAVTINVNAQHSITSFTPTTSYIGRNVVITGTNFTGATAVSFGGTPASSFTVNSNTQITATVAAGSSGDVSVTTPCGGTVSKSGFTYSPYISLTATQGTANEIYFTLKDAFAAINNGTHKGDIVLKVNANTTESVAAVLNASAATSSGSPYYTSVNIYPTVSGVSITDNLSTPVIDLNGADNVTIDGRVNATGSTTDMAIFNTSTSSASTIRFYADATNNTVEYCSLQGSNTTAGYGTLFFSTGTTTGNDGNTITNNTITSAGSNLPLNAIYSAGTAAKENSEISITNNNIQDHSGASSSGIFVASNSSAWTITGNRFFQSASRSISGTHRAINIVTASGGGYVINNNIIGYSSASATGTSTFTGSANLVPIELTVAVSPVSEIQGNTIRGISFSTSATTTAGSGIFSGISLLGGTVNIGTTDANTIGAASGISSIVINPSASTPVVQGIYASTTGTVSIQDNSIGGIAINGAATIGFTFYGINTSGTAGNFTISNNTIGSALTTNSIAVGTSGTTTSGVCTFFGIKQAATGTVSITGNTIQNCSAYGTAASIYWGIHNSFSTGTTDISTNNILNGTLQGTGTLTVIYNSAVPTTLNISSNTISTLSTASAAPAIGIQNAGAATTANINGNAINILSSSGASCNISGINSTAGTTVNIYSNTVHALSGSGATSPIVNGISIGGGTTTYVYKNNIYNLSESGAFATTAGAVNGMLMSAGTTIVYAYNNFISELKAPAANIVDAVRGISITSTTALSTYGIYNNTVYLNASSSGTNFGSSGIYHSASLTATTSALDLRNNIIVNNSSPKGTGYTVAFRRSGGAVSNLLNYATTSNNNDFYAGTPGTNNLIYYDGTSSAQTLYAYKNGTFTAGTIAPRDANSTTELPPFVNISTSPYDLRINIGLGSLCESRGSVVTTPIAITTDYYGTARYPNAGNPVNASYPPTLPDIGAYEFAGITGTLSGTVNVGSGERYTSLTNAGGLFEAIYNAGISGNLTALITSDLTSETGSFELLQWAGSNTLTISPTGGAVRTISGTLNGALISLNGADNVTIDGLNIGGNSLIISNPNTGSSASTIKFTNDATYNTVKNSTITGSTLNTVGGVIFFSTTTGTLGNSNNTIDHNTISCAVDANRPLNAVYSVGTATYLNASNIISNNNIYNFLSRSTASNGINLAANNSAWSISGNNFYETASFIPTATVSYNIIYIINTGDNYSISNNYIGGNASGHSGTWTKTNAFDNIFYGIYVNAGTSTASNIQGNTINNISWSNSSSSLFCGIGVWGGNVNLGTISGNTIGAATGTGTLTFTGGANATFYGIYLSSTSTV